MVNTGDKSKKTKKSKKKSAAIKQKQSQRQSVNFYTPKHRDTPSAYGGMNANKPNTSTNTNITNVSQAPPQNLPQPGLSMNDMIALINRMDATATSRKKAESTMKSSQSPSPSDYGSYPQTPSGIFSHSPTRDSTMMSAPLTGHTVHPVRTHSTIDVATSSVVKRPDKKPKFKSGSNGSSDSSGMDEDPRPNDNQLALVGTSPPTDLASRRRRERFERFSPYTVPLRPPPIQTTQRRPPIIQTTQGRTQRLITGFLEPSPSSVGSVNPVNAPSRRIIINPNSSGISPTHSEKEQRRNMVSRAQVERHNRQMDEIQPDGSDTQNNNDFNPSQ